MSDEERCEKGIDNYIVMFLDLPEQKERLAKLPKYVPDEQLSQQLLKTIQSTYGITFRFRKNINSYLKCYELDNENYQLIQQLTTEQAELFNKMAPAKTYVQYIADSVVLMSKAKNKYGQPNLRSVYMKLACCGQVMIQQLAASCPVRGAIDIGLEIDFGELGTYGSAFYSAHYLKSQVAKYPRVVIGDNLFNYLKSFEQKQENDPLTTVNREIAKRCLSIIRRDTDGQRMLDFLNPRFPNAVGISEQDSDYIVLRKNIKQGFDFLIIKHKQLVKDKISELAFRYSMLIEYYLKHMDKWDDNQHLNVSKKSD